MCASPLISTIDLAERLGGENIVVFDCRFNLMKPEQGREAYLEAHIPGAFYAHLDDDLAAPVTAASGRHPLPDPEGFNAWLDQHGVGEHTLVVAYDGGPGAIAARLWWMLRWLGHEQVAVLDGGWKAWSGEERPVEQRIPDRPAGPKTDYRRPSRDIWLSTEDLLGKQDQMVLIDARSADRFAGVSEPIDRRAGHIPGAINADFMGNLGEEGQFLTRDALRVRFTEILGSGSDDPGAVVHSCGSGVTACHNLLAMELAGLPGSKLYPGSWSRVDR